MADDACTERTGERALMRRTGEWGGKDVDSWANWGRKGADKRSGGRAHWAVGASRARRGGRGDEGVGLGLKGAIPPTSFHSWASNPLASSERECAGCLGVQWGPGGFNTIFIKFGVC